MCKDPVSSDRGGVKQTLCKEPTSLGMTCGGLPFLCYHWLVAGQMSNQSSSHFTVTLYISFLFVQCQILVFIV